MIIEERSICEDWPSSTESMLAGVGNHRQRGRGAFFGQGGASLVQRGGNGFFLFLGNRQREANGRKRNRRPCVKDEKVSRGKMGQHPSHWVGEGRGSSRPYNRSPENKRTNIPHPEWNSTMQHANRKNWIRGIKMLPEIGADRLTNFCHG